MSLNQQETLTQNTSRMIQDGAVKRIKKYGGKRGEGKKGGQKWIRRKRKIRKKVNIYILDDIVTEIWSK